MRPSETAAALAEFAGRGAGTDAERRAAVWLAAELRHARRPARLETFWCRPNWPLAQAWHCVPAIAGSLLAVHHATLGGALLFAALLCVLADALTGMSPGRRLTRERASQNVVSPPPPTNTDADTDTRTADTRTADTNTVDADPRRRLVITANLDAGRTGLVYRPPLRALVARLRHITPGGRLAPGHIGWLVAALVWLIAVAAARKNGSTGTAIGVVQLIPTAALVIELALLLELAGAPIGPAAGDNASGVAVAVALTRALDVAPPRRLAVDLVLQGAGDGQMIGLRRHLRTHRTDYRPKDTIVLGIAACGAGRPAYWVSDGAFIPLRYHPRLQRLSARHGAAPHRGRGVSPAFPGRARGMAALTLGGLDARGLAPRSHTAQDVGSALDPRALDALLAHALTVIDALDAELTGTPGAAPAAA